MHLICFKYSEIAHLLTCCYDSLSVWGMAHHSHAHGQCELSCTAGVMLNVRRSDRNANQVSKLTLHSRRCTSDLQWFISQSESMCHCVEWLVGKHGSCQGASLSRPPPAASPAAWTALSTRTTDGTVAFQTGKPHATYLSKSLKSVLKGYYKSRR